MDYATHVEGVLSLAAYGISVQMAQGYIVVAEKSFTDTAPAINYPCGCRCRCGEIDRS